MHDKWKVKEEELKQECEDAKQAAIHEMSKMLNSLSRLLVWSWLLADLLVVWRLGCGDDIDCIAGVEEELAKLVERLDKASTAYGMEISADTTKLRTKHTSGINTEIKVNGQKLETVWNDRSISFSSKKD